jgi:hypothetical protein
MGSGLDSAAYEICIAIREEGAFAEELKLVPNGQPAACTEVIAALRRQCPGYRTDEYQAAIARGMHASR